MAVSSRGLGHGPLKAGTRVRIPLPLFEAPAADAWGRWPTRRGRPVRLSVRTAPFHGAERGSIPLRAIAVAPTCSMSLRPEADARMDIGAVAQFG